ncbi:glycosyltransferase family 2 protein [Flavobacterium aciduliphilum]|uniref:Glycosyltransferase involved in cell wall biosynthesis n=1 Tax=Flavobacterium aciduliphilum TaxID=1101402 RepID=A0A328Y7W0_9FLAO|nr:glycosyltransferase family 2 protein [Flavobacterium aciduliphilum]RAR69989.1 glycosyltransferase involved in cell wall biosynthesis [Flavobacterium aciduliphilum]
MQKDISVIISTYNSPEWLRKVLYGYNTQTYRNFEVIIADDGSDERTQKIIEEIQKEVFFPILHVWHEDNGFQKTIILNKALLASTTAYILMTDGDCIPREDFIEEHIKYREEGYFLSGGYYKLPMNISKSITKEDIFSGQCFDLSWLKKHGVHHSFKNSKLYNNSFKSWLLNYLTPTTPSWNGHNSSGWKSDFLAVNGFDERMQYGGEDREFGERLINLGIKAKQIRYSTVCIHLDHERGYVKPEMIQKNLMIRKETKQQKKTWTEFGIKKKQLI